MLSQWYIHDLRSYGVTLVMEVVVWQQYNLSIAQRGQSSNIWTFARSLRCINQSDTQLWACDVLVTRLASRVHTKYGGSIRFIHFLNLLYPFLGNDVAEYILERLSVCRAGHAGHWETSWHANREPVQHPGGSLLGSPELYDILIFIEGAHSRRTRNRYLSCEQHLRSR